MEVPYSYMQNNNKQLLNFESGAKIIWNEIDYDVWLFCISNLSLNLDKCLSVMGGPWKKEKELPENTMKYLGSQY